MSISSRVRLDNSTVVLRPDYRPLLARHPPPTAASRAHRSLDTMPEMATGRWDLPFGEHPTTEGEPHGWRRGATLWATVLAAIAFCAFAGNANQLSTSGSIRASSETNGSFGTVWELTITPDNSGIVTVKSWATGKSNERRFRISAAQRTAILRAAEEARFGDLPARLGPPTIPLDGPMNSLEIGVGDLVRKVVLDDPPSARGPEVERFRRVWRAIVEMSPIPPPPVN